MEAFPQTRTSSEFSAPACLIRGGTFTNNGNSLSLGQSDSSRGTYNVDGGTLTVGVVGSSGGTSTFNFNGGTLQAAAPTTSFSSGLTTANVRNGGAVIDTNGSNITIPQSLVHSTVSGDNATDGGLAKRGSGTLTLTGANTFNGPTTVSTGTLNLGNANALQQSTLTLSSSGGGNVTLDGGCHG